MTKEEKALYEGKFFYEVVKVKKGRNAGTIQLFGPFDNIYYVSPYAGASPKLKFMQVIDGKPVQAFTED